MKKRRSMDSGEASSRLGLGGIFQGLGELVETLGHLAEKGAEIRREGTLGDPGDGKGLKGVFGFTVKVGGLGKESIQVEPFGNIHRNQKGEPTVGEEREPLVDVFDEKERVLVVAELPGVEDSQVKTEIDGDVLLLTAEGKGRKYRKEVLLPRRFPPSALSRLFRDGILEVSLIKKNA